MMIKANDLKGGTVEFSPEHVVNLEIPKTETFIENDIIADGIKVGTVELCPEHQEISRLNIFEPYQNKGYGTQVVNYLKRIGYTSLWVRSDNPRAIHVYEKCGFKRGETCMFVMSCADNRESEGTNGD